MTIRTFSRRDGLRLVAAGAAASVLPMRDAFAQSSGRPAPRDWYSTVLEHHEMLAKSFKVLIAPDNDAFEKRNLQLRNLDQLMGAHSFAEEVVLYPALARAGLEQDAERFYVIEGRLKILRARLEEASRANKDWRQHANVLEKALLEHAQEEEKDEFAKLRDKLGAAENRLLGAEYARRFSSVIAAPAR